ncbi:hypothetical protein GCM10022221_45110 [Actinocorallia aurea]
MTKPPGADRQAAAARLVAVYGPLVRGEVFDDLTRALRAGEPTWAVECLAQEMVAERVFPAAGDGVEFRRLLKGSVLSPDTPPDLRDLVLFGADPPDGHWCYLPGSADPSAVRAAVAACFPVRPERIGVLVDGEFAPDDPERPAVLITADAGSAGLVFDAGREFAELTGGAGELAVAMALCRALDTVALLGPHGLTPNQWVLVTAAGGHGVVLADGEAADEGRWDLLFAYEPIEGAPGLPLRGA